ncbi:protein phosphatase 1 regulatory subunit 3B [Salarias fasciatus]|uniref:CBM21 domain-containing protein n=1 Tax=Salarias fasciatus TaxID=181472 RepID=A0A672IBY9_SALFA|nr:protein phosphatase 1 regulatory subunit 3B [Salarias fasciatus]
MPIDMTPLCPTPDDFLPPARRPVLRFERRARPGAKRVTFADQRGLALTRVKVFSQLDDPVLIPAAVREALRSAAAVAAAAADRPRLDFAPPSSDYLRFRRNLETNLVSLERCELRGGALAGTVRVKNVAFEKRVALRVSFDAWRSHADVDCVYVRDAFPGAAGDAFAFSVPLPAAPPPQRRAEFAVRYAVAGAEHWDSNHGNNYGIAWAPAWSRRPDSAHSGSSAWSRGALPDWPGFAGYEDVGPYY